MVTAGHIVKAMRDIDDEAGKNDWIRAIIDVPGVGGGVVDRLAELDLPVVPYNGARHRSTRNGSSTLERRTTGHCGSGLSRARSTSIRMTTSSLPRSARSSGASTPAAVSRSNRRMTCVSEAYRHRTGLMRWRSLSLAGQMPRRSMSRVTPAKALRGI